MTGPFPQFHDNAYFSYFLRFYGRLYTADASAIATMMGHTCAGLLGLFALDSRHRPNSKLTKLSALTAPIWFINFSMFMFNCSVLFSKILDRPCARGISRLHVLVGTTSLATGESLFYFCILGLRLPVQFELDNSYLPRFRVSSKHVAGSISEGFKKPMAL